MLSKLFNIFKKRKTNKSIVLSYVYEEDKDYKEDIFNFDLNDKSLILENALKLKLNKSAYQQYVSTVKGNNNLTLKQVKRKLYRNLLLAIKHDNKQDNNKELYSYGALKILIVDNEVVYIKNYSKVPESWFKDTKTYEELNKILGIYY